MDYIFKKQGQGSGCKILQGEEQQVEGIFIWKTSTYTNIVTHLILIGVCTSNII
jgi:hypothetical protein